VTLPRPPAWISFAIVVELGSAAAAPLPDGGRALGASAGLPFVVIGASAAWRSPAPGTSCCGRAERPRARHAAHAMP
jgi:hypothetical protein